MSNWAADEIEKLRRLRAQVGDQGEDFDLLEWMYDVGAHSPRRLDRSQGLWVVELLRPRLPRRLNRMEVFLSPHLARQRLAAIVTEYGGAWSTLDDGVAVHVIMLWGDEARLSYWATHEDTPWDVEPRRINIHRKPKGGVEHRPRPPVLPRTWYERIPFELILFGPWTPYLFAFAVLAGFIHGCSSL